MRTKIFSLFLGLVMVAFLLGTSNFSFASSDDFVSSEEVSPGQSPAGFKPTAKFFGRIMFRWETTLNKDSGTQAGKTGSNFYMKRFRMGFKGNITDKLSYHVQTELTGDYFRYAWFNYKIAKKAFQIKAGRMKSGYTREKKSSGKFLFGDVASASKQSRSITSTKGNTEKVTAAQDIYMGLDFHGRILGGKLEYNVWIINNRNQLTSLSKNSEHFYTIAGRIQFDPMGKWKHGKEWLQTSKTKASIGLAAYYTKARTDGSGGQVLNDLFGFTADYGFTISKFYTQGGFFYAKAKLATTQVKLAAHWGVFVDAAFTVNKYFVPAVRWEYYNSAFQAAGTNASRVKTMQVAVVANIHPQGLGHRFKIQPEFLYTLGQVYAGAKNNVVKPVSFRLTATLNY